MCSRPYLTGERFSRVDLTVASAFAAFAQPKEMPTFHSMRAPERLAADVHRWGERPTMRWVREEYRLSDNLSCIRTPEAERPGLRPVTTKSASGTKQTKFLAAVMSAFDP